MPQHDDEPRISPEDYTDLNFVERLVIAEAIRQAVVYWSRHGGISDALKALAADFEAAAAIPNPIRRRQKQNIALKTFRRRARKGFSSFDTRVLDKLVAISLKNARFKYGIYWERDAIRPRHSTKAVVEANRVRKLQLSGDLPGKRNSMLLTRNQIITNYLTSVRKRMNIIHSRRSSPAEKLIARQTNERNLRTVQRTLAQGAIATAEHAAIDEIANRYRWWSVIDHRTTVRCTKLHRKEFFVNRGPLPPQHYNCRSEVHPIVGNLRREDEREFTRRAAVNYQAWFRKQKPELQNDLLGSKALGDKFRAGKLESVPAIWRTRSRLLSANGTIRTGKLGDELNDKWGEFFQDPLSDQLFSIQFP